MKFSQGIPDLVKIGQNYPGTLHEDLIRFIVPATLNRQSDLLDWNGIRLLGQPRRYKHYTRLRHNVTFYVHCLSYYYPYIIKLYKITVAIWPPVLSPSRACMSLALSTSPCNFLTSGRVLITSLSFSDAQQPKSGRCHLIVEVSRSHTIRRTHAVELLRTSDKPVAEAATHTTHNKQDTNIHAVSIIRTRDPRKRAATDVQLRPHGHWDQLYLHSALTICNCWPQNLQTLGALMSIIWYSNDSSMALSELIVRCWHFVWWQTFERNRDCFLKQWIIWLVFRWYIPVVLQSNIYTVFQTTVIHNKLYKIYRLLFIYIW
jgi:hypothetical protein